MHEPPDEINQPAHYTFGTIEVLDVIEDWGLNFVAGNIIKYVARHPYKGTPLRDLRKARFYLDRLIARLEETSK